MDFLARGPGLGSESLNKLTAILQTENPYLPGSLWHLDLPGDGSNRTFNIKESFKNWSFALVEAVGEFTHVILVAHSTGGMYSLSTPELEEFLEGIVLLDSAPDAEWQASFAKTVKNHPIPEAELLQEKYRQNPTDELLKAFTITCAPYLFTSKGFQEGIKMLKGLPFNYETCQWSEEYFDTTYRAKWVSTKMPTLILAGDSDLITPIDLFVRAKDFCSSQIVLKSIKNAGHFPWIENPGKIVELFQEYFKSL